MKSILLVDDDEATNFINKLLITKANITEDLKIARNGKEAIEVLCKLKDVVPDQELNAPGLIILDINMPVMDGFGFLKAFQEIDFPGKKSVIIAVLTTSLNPKDVDKVKEAGIRHFLNKPLTKTQLEELLQEHSN